METEYRPAFVSLQCDREHIIHRIGDKSYPEHRQMTVKAEDADNWEIVPVAFVAKADACGRKLDEITAYDSSAAVNGFTIDGTEMWLDKATRVGLVNSVNATEIIGGTTITLWYGSLSFELPLALARQMLAALEVYALECFNVTARHKAAVEALMESADNADAIEAFDITEGYPAKPQFFTTDRV